MEEAQLRAVPQKYQSMSQVTNYMQPTGSIFMTFYDHVIVLFLLTHRSTAYIENIFWRYVQCTFQIMEIVTFLTSVMAFSVLLCVI